MSLVVCAVLSERSIVLPATLDIGLQPPRLEHDLRVAAFDPTDGGFASFKKR